MVTVYGQQIVFLESEGDARAVVFVHGNSSSARTWLPVLTGPFGQRFRCLAFDLPGHGQSAPAADHSAYSLGYLQQLSIPSLWRGRVQLIPGAGHAAHQEATATFTELLDQFLADLS